MPPRVLSLVGLFLFVFAVLALAGPGRIDILDGQTRYEVARSLATYGDNLVRDPHVSFNVFPGPNGERYTYYRLPHSLVGVPAVWLADLTGPVSEPRRQFAFVLVSAVASGILALAFAAGFLEMGMSIRAACLWAVGGVFCTPCFYYGTSTFDEIFGSVAVVGALVTAARARRSDVWAAAAGLLIGLAFNCKQPLGIFVLPVLALADDPVDPRPARFRRALLIGGGLALGVAVHFGYFYWKYPPGRTPDHSLLQADYMPVWPGQPVWNLAALAVSPGAGVLWYAPSILLTGAGFAPLWRWNRRVALAGSAATIVFVGFIGSMTIFKGDIAWGPRYLTPVIAAGWLLAPAGAARLPRPATVGIVTAGLTVQLLGLAVDPHRLYLEHRLPTPILPPQANFSTALAHLVQRPRELVEILRSGGSRAELFTPAWLPTAAPLAIERPPLRKTDPARYVIFDTPRPWWASFRHLDPGDRPVDIGKTAALFLAVAAIGLGLTAAGLTKSFRSIP